MSKWEKNETHFFKVSEACAAGEQLVGFVEVSLVTTLRYLGEGIPPADRRPLLANLAVEKAARGRGIGGALLAACEREAILWGCPELILQVFL